MKSEILLQKIKFLLIGKNIEIYTNHKKTIYGDDINSLNFDSYLNRFPKFLKPFLNSHFKKEIIEIQNVNAFSLDSIDDTIFEISFNINQKQKFIFLSNQIIKNQIKIEKNLNLLINKSL